MDFAEAVAYLDDHINLEATVGGPTAGAVHGLSLDRMRGLVDVLGDPQASAPVIHITGTNGKGSVAKMVSALLGAHGLTVGTYGSPHLESIRERITRNVDIITEVEFADVVSEIAALESLFPDRPSYFDLLTATVFAWFAREAVEVMVVEVGLLGRYDSTNVVDADVAVITNVGRDHTDGVGEWRRSIAQEKAGIISDRSAVIIGETDPELVDVFRAEGGALHWVRDEEFGSSSSAIAVGGRLMGAYTPTSRYHDLFLPLHGSHQVDNAAAAIAAVETFFGRPLDTEVVQEAFSAVSVPGRFEVVHRSPLIVLDSAHNPDGTAAAATTFHDEFEPDGSLTLLVGLLGGRDIEETLAPLVGLGARRIICVEAESPRAISAVDVASGVSRIVSAGGAPAIPEVTIVDDVETAIGRATDRMNSDDALLIAGSTYVVGAARTALRRSDLGSTLTGP
ncbi:bifunctional folylpolyglutamate synthase/dihydrofolate synthase [Actinospongicola halichondriae]|uniref:bifunctional folylpolyglutamate synthase/dihydrofolate synthase n=1 Tax=Actinospongicola halichondriae TaxID=3236844 RepID=UPI003D4F7C1B